MTNWFECRIKYEKTLENGTRKKVSESYLVDAMTFTEAESRIIEEVTPFVVGGFEVTHISKDPISELSNATDEKADLWYKAKIAFISLDEKTGSEKKSFSTMYVRACNFSDALKHLNDSMKGTMSYWECHSISLSKVIDVFGLKANEN